MKGQTTNEVRAKILGGNHCDQDLLDALDEIDALVADRDALRARIGAMLAKMEADRLYGRYIDE